MVIYSLTPLLLLPSRNQIQLDGVLLSAFLSSCPERTSRYGYYFRQVIRSNKFRRATHTPPAPDPPPTSPPVLPTPPLALFCLLTTEIRAIKCVSELSTTFPTLGCYYRANCWRRAIILAPAVSRDRSYCIFYRPRCHRLPYREAFPESVTLHFLHRSRGN